MHSCYNIVVHLAQKKQRELEAALLYMCYLRILLVHFRSQLLGANKSSKSSPSIWSGEVKGQRCYKIHLVPSLLFCRSAAHIVQIQSHFRTNTNAQLYKYRCAQKCPLLNCAAMPLLLCRYKCRTFGQLLVV